MFTNLDYMYWKAFKEYGKIFYYKSSLKFAE